MATHWISPKPARNSARARIFAVPATVWVQEISQRGTLEPPVHRIISGRRGCRLPSLPLVILGRMLPKYTAVASARYHWEHFEVTSHRLLSLVHARGANSRCSNPWLSVYLPGPPPPSLASPPAPQCSLHPARLLHSACHLALLCRRRKSRSACSPCSSASTASIPRRYAMVCLLSD